MKKYKIVNKKRFSIFLILSFIFVIGIGSLFRPANRVHSNLLQSPFVEVEVSKGDTLWNMALEYMPQKYNIRKMIYEIKQFNNMDTSYIYPGQTVKVPIIE